MSDYPKYWKGAFNRQLGLAVMRQKSATENSQMIAHICLHEREASELADALIATLNTNYAAVEKLCKQQHEALDRMDTEMIYIHEIAADDRSYSPEKKHLFASDEGRACLAQSKEALTAYAALFLKTGGSNG